MPSRSLRIPLFELKGSIVRHDCNAHWIRLARPGFTKNRRGAWHTKNRNCGIQTVTQSLNTRVPLSFVRGLKRCGPFLSSRFTGESPMATRCKFDNETCSAICQGRVRLLTPFTVLDKVVVASSRRFVHLSLFACSRPRRLARPRTPPFHGDNTGSNPVGDASKINHIGLPSIFSAPIW